MVIDLSAVTFIDSSILGELARAKRRVDLEPGEQLAVIAPADGFAARLFDQLGFEVLPSVFDMRADALRSLESA